MPKTYPLTEIGLVNQPTRVEKINLTFVSHDNNLYSLGYPSFKEKIKSKRKSFKLFTRNILL